MTSNCSLNSDGRKTSPTLVVTHFLDRVWNQGLVEECDLLFHDQYEIRHDPGDPWDRRLLSREEFKDRVRLSRQPVPDQRFDIVEAFEKDDSVFVAWTWAGTHRGELGGVEPSGKKLTMSGATIYFLQNGRISGHWQVADRLGIAKQLMPHQETGQ